jgi:hypothetical protein
VGGSSVPVLSSADRVVRRLKYGAPITVVSGLPRSGTSMMMQMLEAGGMQLLTDGVRQADEQNPKGYYELEAVKGLDKGEDTPWLADARGKAVKIISFLLTWLPDTYDYGVIFMERNLDEVVMSQNAMLRHRGHATDLADVDRASVLRTPPRTDQELPPAPALLPHLDGPLRRGPAAAA